MMQCTHTCSGIKVKKERKKHNEQNLNLKESLRPTNKKINL
jgi:hypothetical protein